MGHSNTWKVALLVILVAMMVGFGRLEQQKKQPPLAESGAQVGDAAEPNDSDPGSQAHDPVSQFLTDLVGEDLQARATAEGNAPPQLPLIADLPPLPQEFWPVPRLITQASYRNGGIATY